MKSREGYGSGNIAPSAGLIVARPELPFVAGVTCNPNEGTLGVLAERACMESLLNQKYFQASCQVLNQMSGLSSGSCYCALS